LAQGGSRGKGKSSSGGSSSGSSGSSSGGSSGGSGGGSSGGGSSGGGSSGGGGSSSSGGGGQSGARASRSSSSPSNASSTSGSSSTTTGANTQSVASVSGQSTTSTQSFNSVTQGANRGLVTDSQNISETARADAPTFNANPTVLGTKPALLTQSQMNTQYQNAPASQYPTMVAKYGVEVANKLATQTYYTQQQANAMMPSTNTNNLYLQNESASLTHAEARQAKFVDSNQFMSNPQPKAFSEIPDKIYTRTNLYQQAGQDGNPLSILEGNPFIDPSQQFLPQVNEEFAPRPIYSAFTNNPYIGVHQNSPLAPNADITATQRKSVSDYATDIRTHKYFPLLVIGIVVIVIFAVMRKRGK